MWHFVGWTIICDKLLYLYYLVITFLIISTQLFSQVSIIIIIAILTRRKQKLGTIIQFINDEHWLSNSCPECTLFGVW